MYFTNGAIQHTHRARQSVVWPLKFYTMTGTNILSAQLRTHEGLHLAVYSLTLTDFSLH